MHEVKEFPETRDSCWRSRYDSAAEASEALRRAARHPATGVLTHYVDVRGHVDDGLVYRIVPVLKVG